MEKILNSDTLAPFKAGTVQNGNKLFTFSTFKFKKVKISFPSRINAMAIDPSRVAVQCERCFTPGEILFSINIPLTVTAEIVSGEDQICSNGRTSLIKHAVGIMRWLTGFKEHVKIELEGVDYPHCGFGSSGRTIAAVCSAINEMLGNLVNADDLQLFLAQNHGEELSDNNDLLIPVQCIGGAASSGLHHGGIQLLTGKSQMIASADIQDEYKMAIGFPENRVFRDSQEAMAAELHNMKQFYDIGKTHGDRIAYRILHELLPAITQKDWQVTGNVIEWYRYDLGSNEACSFSHPSLLKWANLLRNNKKILEVDICGISSVGPALYTVSRCPEKSRDFFQRLGLKCIIADFYNNKYAVILKEKWNH